MSLAWTLGQTTTCTRDAFGRPLAATTGADSPAFGYTDGRGNLTSEAPYGDAAHGQTFTLLNQIQVYTPPILPPATASATTNFTYTADRKLDTISKPDGTAASWSYDPTSGKLTKVTLATTPTNVSATYGYYTSTGAAPGELSTITGPYGVNLSFTRLGGLLTGTSWSGGVVGSVAWTYDSDFARTSETLAGNTGTSTTRFGFDLDKFVTCASPTNCSPPGADALAVTRDGGTGLLSKLVLGGLTESYAYNNFGELSQQLLTSTPSPTTILAEIDYDSPPTASPAWVPPLRRDALGRVMRRVETIQGVQSTFDYTYSAEGYLNDVKLNGAPFEHYDYNLQGNRIAATTPPPQMTVTVLDTQYDSQDRLTKYGNFNYTYTLNGELLTKKDTSNNQTTTYTYDSLGNLISVQLPDGTLISYVIDGMNRRVAKKRNGTVVKQWLYHDGLKPVAELDATGALVSSFVYASNKNIPDYMIRGGITYMIVSDQLGSPRAVVDAFGNTGIWFSATYSAFGVPSIQGIQDFVPFGFAGGLYDVDTGLVRFGARDYDPVVGRWTSKDPILFDGGQANLYVYVNNDPVNRIDDSGEGFLDCAKAIEDYLKARKNVQGRLDDIDRHDGCSDPGHDKALEQARNREDNARQKVLNACKDPSTLAELGLLALGGGLLLGPAGGGSLVFAF